MTLTEIRRILAERGLAAQKRFGQHFLHDQNLCHWLVRQAQLGPGEPVWEVGPGLGSLTGALIEAGHAVRAIEIDRGFVLFLRERFAASGRFEVIEADAVAFCEEKRLSGRVVMGNLPYNVTTPLIMALLGCPGVERMVFMVQDEAADRLAAVPGTAAYGAVSVLVQCRCQVEILRRVKPTVFFPEPAVRSAVIQIILRHEGTLSREPGVFDVLVRRGFSGKRKQLAKLLGGWAPTGTPPGPGRAVWEGVLGELGARPDARAESLSPAQWAELGRRAGKIFEIST